MIKCRILLFVLLIGAMTTGNSFAASNPWDIKLPFKSAIIHYDVKNPEKGVETLYIRDNGKVTARVTKTKGRIMFIKVSTDTLQITDPDWIVTVDMEKKSAMKITNPVKTMSQEYKELRDADGSGNRKSWRRNTRIYMRRGHRDGRDHL